MMEKLENRPRFQGRWPDARSGWLMVDCWKGGLLYAAHYLKEDEGREVLCMAKLAADGSVPDDGADIPWAMLSKACHEVMGYGCILTETIPAGMPDLPYRLMDVQYLEVPENV